MPQKVEILSKVAGVSLYRMLWPDPKKQQLRTLDRCPYLVGPCLLQSTVLCELIASHGIRVDKGGVARLSQKSIHVALDFFFKHLSHNWKDGDGPIVLYRPSLSRFEQWCNFSSLPVVRKYTR